MASRTVLAVGGLFVVLAAVVGGWYLVAVGTDFQRPSVASVDTEFGRVTAETSVIHSRVVLDNPNERTLPGTATIRYRMAMNGVDVASGRKRGVSVAPGRSVLTVNATMNNSKIPAWWVTHVNGNETTVVTTTGRVAVDGLPVGFELPKRRQHVETNLLGALANTSDRRVSVANESILAIGNQQASWGTATADRTPIRFSAGLENVHDRPVQLDGTTYEIRMNGVVVGRGTTADSIRLSPGESGTFRTHAAIDTPKMQQWWVRHLQNDQSTRFAVEIYGVVLDDGERRRVPLAVYRTRGRFGTDMLGNGETTVERLPPGPDAGFARPEMVDQHSTWGEVTEDRTEIVTRATVSNPNDDSFDGLLDLRIDRSTHIHGVGVASGSRTVENVPSGNTTVGMQSHMAHDTVPEWWAAHLNSGERSTVRTVTNGTVDLGLTSLRADLPDRTRTVETDLLRNLNNDTARPVESDGGRRLLTIERTRGSWGRATPDRAPLTIRMTVRNEQPRPTTLTDVTYLTRINDVTLADGTTGETYRIGPNEQATIELRLDLDNSRMEDWWPTHIRNGERSVMHTELSATVESGTVSERVEFDSIGGDTTVKTDLLGQDTDVPSGT